MSAATLTKPFSSSPVVLAGHSKWANIKHRKGAQDQKRSAMFSKTTKAIISATKLGGDDLTSNLRLQTIIDGARAINMPNVKIQYGIDKGMGRAGGEMDELTYECMGAAGVGFIVEAASDNKRRTIQDVRLACKENGGAMGSTSWMFETKGFLDVTFDGHEKPEDELLEIALEVGAEEFVRVENEDADDETGASVVKFTCPLGDLKEIREQAAGLSLAVSDFGETKVAKEQVDIVGEEAVEAFFLLRNALQDVDDVVNVYDNARFSEEDDTEAQ